MASTFQFAGNAAAPGTGFSFAAPTGSVGTAPGVGAPGTSMFGSGTTSTFNAGSGATPASSFSFSTAPSGSSQPTSAMPSSAPQGAAMTVPAFDSLFSGQALWNHIKPLASRALEAEDVLAGQELLYHTQTTYREKLLNLPVLQITQPNMQLRQRLQQNPTVMFHGSEAVLTTPMLDQIISISDDLHVSEEVAACLYAKASPEASRVEITEALDSGTMRLVGLNLQDSSKATEGERVGQIARALYFFEIKLHLKCILLLFQYRLSDPSGLIIQATDELLQLGLIGRILQLIRDYTRLLDSMHEEMLRWSPMKTSSTTMLADFCADERNTAALVLYFIAYHSQLEGDEVAAMIDLIRDLSNQLPILDPFDREHVPNPYDASTGVVAGSPWASPAVQREKNPFDWKNELVEKVWRSGRPQLLRCVSICIMSVLAALDTRSELIDRTTHVTNHFGTGNAFLPPDSVDTRGLQPFHQKLSRQAEREWKRPDVLGILMAGYAMLLRLTPAALTSPRMAPASPFGADEAIDVRKAWKECVQCPTEFKSITFARMGLIPALHVPRDTLLNDCVASEFLLSTLASFTSQYFEVLLCTGDAPISRGKWEQDAKEALRLSAKFQEEQRSFQSWAGTHAADYQQLPTTINLLDRPDCMDDVVAYATAVCSLGPSFAMHFWSRNETLIGSDENAGGRHTILEASPALCELGQQQAADETLRAGYLSFMAALALADDEDTRESGAQYLHRMLSNASGFPESWTSLFEVVRYFVRELDPRAARGVQPVRASSFASTYYYGDTALDPQEINTIGSHGSTNRSNEGTQKRELGEANSYLAMAVLEVVSSVALRSVECRLALLSLPIPVEGPRIRDKQLGDQDSTMMILFAFASQALSPELRGATLSAIAGLLDCSGASPDDRIKLREHGLAAWEILDACQILPIYLFDQYATGLIQKQSDSALGLAFPPSITSAAGRNRKSWLGHDEVYSIVYEMEFIESVAGCYPSTEGFLRLLCSLFQCAGSPWTLGKTYRVRTGCAPYVEYVIYFILPRVLGHFENTDPLPFSSTVARWRLLGLALDVLDAVLCQYLLLMPGQDRDLSDARLSEIHAQLLKSCCSDFKLTRSAPSLFVRPCIDDARVFFQDFDVSAAQLGSEDEQAAGKNVALGASKVPRAPSPGLIVIAEMLLSSGGHLFDSLVRTISTLTVSGFEGLKVDQKTLAFALFNATPPTFASSKTGAWAATKTTSRESLLRKLLPPGELETEEKTDYWRIRGISVALHLFSAAIVRENYLLKIVGSIPIGKVVVPVTSFTGESRKSPLLNTFTLDLTNLSQHLLRSNGRWRMVDRIVDLIGQTSHDYRMDTEISSLALFLTNYINRSQSSDAAMGDISGLADLRGVALSKAFASRLLDSSRRCAFNHEDVVLIDSVLESIVGSLRRPSIETPWSVHWFCGLHDVTAIKGSAWNISQSGACLEAILFLLKENFFYFVPQTYFLGTNSYEIIHRLLLIAWDNQDRNFTAYVISMLRSIELWTASLTRLLKLNRSPLSDGHEEILHSISWILKSMAIEMRLVANAASPMTSLEPVLNLLFEQPMDVLYNVIEAAKLETLSMEALGATSPEVSIILPKSSLKGDPEVFGGYETIDLTELEIQYNGADDERLDALLSWSRQWNSFIRIDCANAHLTQAIHTILLTSNVVDELDGLHRLSVKDLNASRLLGQLLKKMVSAATVGSREPDQICHPTAMRNLAHAVFEASIAERKTGDSQNASIVNLFVIIIGSQAQKTVEQPRMRETTSLLSAAFSLYLDDDGSEGRPIEVEQKDLADLMLVLAQQSLSSAEAKLSPHVRVARSCLVNLLDSSANAEKHRSIMFRDGSEALSQHLLQELVNGIKLLDPGDALLLQQISTIPGGIDALHRANVLNGLEIGAKRYSEIVGESSVNRNFIIQPEIVVNHFLLLLSLMLHESDDRQRLDTALWSTEMMQIYLPTIRTALVQFPSDGELLRVLFQCAALAKLIIQSDGRLESPFSSTVRKQMELLKGFEMEATSLLMHIAEYPLPPNLLSPLPLLAPHSKMKGNAGLDGKCWWEKLELPSEATQELVPYALAGADILRVGLSSLDGPTWPALSETEQLARALCRCVDSMRVTERMIPASSKHTGSFTDDWDLLRSYLTDIISLLILACLRLVRKIHMNDYHPSQSESVPLSIKTLEVALDITRLESEPLVRSFNDENLSQDAMTVHKLAMALRRSLKEAKH